MKKKEPLFAPGEHISEETFFLDEVLERVAKRFVRTQDEYKEKKKEKRRTKL